MGPLQSVFMARCFVFRLYSIIGMFLFSLSVAVSLDCSLLSLSLCLSNCLSASLSLPLTDFFSDSTSCSLFLPPSLSVYLVYPFPSPSPSPSTSSPPNSNAERKRFTLLPNRNPSCGIAGCSFTNILPRGLFKRITSSSKPFTKFFYQDTSPIEPVNRSVPNGGSDQQFLYFRTWREIVIHFLSF